MTDAPDRSPAQEMSSINDIMQVLIFVCLRSGCEINPQPPRRPVGEVGPILQGLELMVAKGARVDRGLPPRPGQRPSRCLSPTKGGSLRPGWCTGYIWIAGSVRSARIPLLERITGSTHRRWTV